MPRECLFRPDSEWARIRARYETAVPRVGLRALAVEYKISISTLMKRAAREGWKQTALQVASARKIVAAAMDQALPIAAQEAANAAAASIVDQMQPLIEQAKTEHIKSQIVRMKRNLSRLDRYTDAGELLGPKDEANYAKAIETFDSIARRTLGMNDTQAGGGSLSVQILTNQAAVQISAPAS